jgi:hypothetical protein
MGRRDPPEAWNLVGKWLLDRPVGPTISREKYPRAPPPPPPPPIPLILVLLLEKGGWFKASNLGCLKGSFSINDQWNSGSTWKRAANMHSAITS